ncbi:hypothetical protein AGMMS49992_19820 [Clostridia bacterium]|nr:hypothetical protein AGMMS49992_19820 [Clostridia bacterium]
MAYPIRRSKAPDPSQSALAILATVIGAGFASGREVMVFFSRFGRFSWVGVIITALTFGALISSIMRLCTRTRAVNYAGLCSTILGPVAGRACAALYALLMLFTAGAMASGVGEIAQITMTIPHAYEIGLVVAVIAAAIWARRGVSALATGAGFLLPVSGLLYIIIAWRGPRYSYPLAAQPAVSWLPAIPLAIGYACLNVTLCCGLLSEIASRSTIQFQRKTTLWFMPLLGGLLAAANATLLPHATRLGNAALPMLMLARGSVPAALLATAALLLAMMTTLTALIRSLAQFIAPDPPVGRVRMPPIVGFITAAALAAGCGLIGFSHLIGVAYPLMGWASAAALVGLLAVGFMRRNQECR